MSEPAVIPPGGGEVVGDAPDRRVEILSDHDALSFPGSQPVHLLNLHTPSCGFGAFLRALHDAGDEPRPAAALSAFDQR